MIKKWSQYITESFRKLSHTEDDIYDYTIKLLDDRINDLFIDIHNEFDTESGDITPGQQFELSDLQERMAKIIAKQVHQNLGKDFKKIKSYDLDIETLKELKDERDSVSEGDEVIAVYFDGGYSIYKFKVNFHLTYSRQEGMSGLGGSTPGSSRGESPEGTRTWYDLEDAYLVVKVSTYNDFVSDDNQL